MDPVDAVVPVVSVNHSLSVGRMVAGAGTNRELRRPAGTERPFLENMHGVGPGHDGAEIVVVG